MKVRVILALCVVTILPAVAAGAEPARVAAQELSVPEPPAGFESLFDVIAGLDALVIEGDPVDPDKS